MKPGLDLKLVGIGGILAALGAAVQAQWDNDPNTVAQWPVVIALVLGGIGDLLARRNNVTSEQVGAK